MACDDPVPDGRGRLGGAWFLPGPWLQPAFHRKGHAALARNAAVRRDLADRFDALLASLPTFPGILRQRAPPTKDGFTAVARLLNDRLRTSRCREAGVAASAARGGLDRPARGGVASRIPSFKGAV